MLEKVNPNHLTSVRLILIFAIAPLLLYSSSLGALIICAALMLIAELSDCFDGVLARRCGKVTDFGKFYDPYCDSVYRLAIFICLIHFGLPIWAAIIFVVRDVTVAYLRIYMMSKGYVMATRSSGKAKAVSQMIAQYVIVAYLLAIAWGVSPITATVFDLVTQITVGTALGITLYSLIDYAFFVYLYDLRQKRSAGSA